MHILSEMQNLPLSEKRAYSRFPVAIPLSYFEENSNYLANAHTYDISEEGLCMVADRELVTGSCLDIFLKMMDNGEKIYKKGRVIWTNIIDSNRYRIGIRFDEPNLKPVPLVLRTIMAQRKY